MANTKTRLIIEGDVVTREDVESLSDGERIRRSRVKRQDFFDAVNRQEGTMTFLPPISCGHIVARQEKGKKSCVVIQLPPAMRSFVYSPDNRLYTVAMPYIVIAINFVGQAIEGASTANCCGVFMYYRNEPVGSLDDTLAYPNMPNVYGDGALCWGKEAIALDLPLGRKVEKAVEALFASSFNKHELEYHWVPSKNISGHPQSFQEWETRSREDPAFVLGLNWRPAGVTIRQVLERGVKNG